MNGFTCSHLTNDRIESFLEKNEFKKTQVTKSGSKYERGSVTFRTHHVGKNQRNVSQRTLNDAVSAVIHACFNDELNKQEQTSNQQKPSEIRKLHRVG